MSAWLDGASSWLGANPQWLGLALFLIACAECLAIVGILVPGTLLLFSVAVLAGSGALTLGQTLALGYAGGLLGDGLSYALGRYFHQDIRRLPGLRHHPQWMAGAEDYFQRYGVASLLVGRYIGPLRPMLPMVAGMLNMPLGRFITVSLVAAAGWAVAYLLPGWAAGAALRLPLPPDFWGQTAIVAAGLGLALLLSVQSSLRQQRHASLISAGACLLLLLGLLIGWPLLGPLDQGLLALIQEQRSSSLDELMVLVTRLGDLHAQLAAGLLLCLLLLLARQRRAALFAAFTLLGSALANGALKDLFARQRPDVLLEPLHGFSFPSGHSSAAFAFFLVLGVLAGRDQPVRLRLAWLLLAGLPALAIALSRVYLGAHWPSDIIAGALLACCLCALSLSLSQWQAPLAPLSAKIWWLVLPGCLALLGTIATWHLSAGLLLYRH